MSDTSKEVLDAVFGATDNPEQVIDQTKTVYQDKDGNILAQGKPSEVVVNSDWVARVSSMSLTVKVTPKIDDTFLSVERGMTVDINTFDRDKIDGIWVQLQSEVVGGVFNTLTKVQKQMQEVKKGR